MPKYYAVLFNEDENALIESYATKFKVSKAEVLRQSFHVYLWLQELTGRDDMLPKDLFLYFIKQQKKLIVKEEDLDRCAWYIVKLCYTVQSLKEKRTQEQLERARKVIRQVAERMNVDLSELEQALERFYQAQTKENMIALNEALKKAVMKLIADALKAEVVTSEKTTKNT